MDGCKEIPCLHYAVCYCRSKSESNLHDNSPINAYNCRLFPSKQTTWCVCPCWYLIRLYFVPTKTWPFFESPKKTLHWQACKVGTLQGSRIATMFRTMIFVWVPSPSWNISDRFLKAVEKHLRNSYHLIIMPAHWEFDLYTVYINGGVHIAMSIVVIARACHSNIKLALLDCSHGRSFLKLPKLAESELHPFTRRMGNLVTRNGKTVILGGFPNFCNLSMFSISPAHPITRETGIVISAFGRSIWLNTGRLFYHSSKHRID